MSELLRRINNLRWFHSIDLGHGIVTPGDKSLETLAREQAVIFDPIRLQGTTVLDVGAWNGAHSFAAAKRGAVVLATDHYVWTHDVWRGREGFDLANSALGLNIEAKEIDLPEIAPETVGEHDVVLFLGVLYHLPSPLPLLQRVAAVAKHCLVVETHADLLDIETPALAYYPGTTLNNDPTNFFGPNKAFVIEALKECGFVLFDTCYEYGRLTVHAWRDTSLRRFGDQEEQHRMQSKPSFTLRLKRRLKSLLKGAQ